MWKLSVPLLAEVDDILQGVSRDGDTLLFSGMNVQIVNGSGSTRNLNGLGNLIIGYNAQIRQPDPPAQRSGSHNIVVGDQHEFLSDSGIVAGELNKISNRAASVLAGLANSAEGFGAAVLGGSNNHATGDDATVSGGGRNTASGRQASVSGGIGNEAARNFSSIPAGRNFNNTGN